MWGVALAMNSFQAMANVPLTVAGWAVDAPAHRPAKEVYIDVDGRLFPVSYGVSRPDVAAALKEPAYERSGFRGQITAGPGNHKVFLRVVNAAGTGYYTGPSFSLNIK